LAIAGGGGGGEARAVGRPGAIFCLHDGRELTANPDVAATLGAVRVIMPHIEEKRFPLPDCKATYMPTKSPNASSR